MYVILVYDIKFDNEGKKVLPKVFKTCKKYLTHIQNSVFEGELSKSQLLQLNNDLNKFMRSDIDSVIVFKSRDPKWLEKEFWALEDDATSNFL